MNESFNTPINWDLQMGFFHQNEGKNCVVFLLFDGHVGRILAHLVSYVG